MTNAFLLGVDLGPVEECDIPEGWPEFTVTLRFYVNSEDPDIVEKERQRVFEQLPDLMS